MDYLPLFTRITAAPCLVVGGGDVAARKAAALLRAGARVTVRAERAGSAIRALADAGRVQLATGPFVAADLAGQRLVIAATNDTAANRQIAAAADSANIFCNVVDDRALSSAILPAIIDRSPVIVAVSTGGAAPVLATRLRGQLEALLPARLGALAELMGRWRQRVRERFDTVSERRHFWLRFLDGAAGDQILGGGDGDALLQAALDEPAAGAGIGLITGAGPGDPELLTLAALRALNTADVILYDNLVTPAVLDLARRDAEMIAVGKTPGGPSVSQAAINAQLVALVRAGKRVCRIKGGDPFIFGRGGEEIEALEAAGLPWRVIPGITAAAGCAAAAGIPLTHRDIARTLSLTTARVRDDSEPDWSALAGEQQTAVFYMGVARLAHTCAALIDAGRNASCPALLIENGTRDDQRIVRGTLATLPQLAEDATIGSPALLIVGTVAGLSHT